MNKLAHLLEERMKNPGKGVNKMSALAQREQNMPAVFGGYQLSEREREQLKNLLEEFRKPKQDTESDFEQLVHITQEVRSINNQAALLHGERIQKVQGLLKKYQEGAFTTWLVDTYGNRQTPYNLLQYYELYSQMPNELKPTLDQMPRQAIYTLATRAISVHEKKEFISKYNGETKKELLRQIRDQFPLETSDRRKENPTAAFVKDLKRAHDFLKRTKVRFTRSQKRQILSLLEEMQELL